MTITYIKGDATQPVGKGNRIIVHCCNDLGAWGSGFVVALSKKWPLPESAYRLWKEIDHNHPQNPFSLGSIQIVPVDIENEISVCNLIGQHKFGGRDSQDYPYVRYDAIREGFRRLARTAKNWNSTIHMPRMGCGLAGGEWAEIEKIIHEELSEFNVFVYDLVTSK